MEISRHLQTFRELNHPGELTMRIRRTYMLVNNALRDKMDERNNVRASDGSDERADRGGIDGRFLLIQHVDERWFSGPVPDEVTYDHFLICLRSTAESTISAQTFAGRHLMEENTLPDRIYLDRSLWSRLAVLRCVDGGKADVLDELGQVLFKINKKVSGSRYFQILDSTTFEMVLFHQDEDLAKSVYTARIIVCGATPA